MLNDVIATYRSLLSCRKSLPGMRLEDALSDDAVKSLEKELKWLINKKENIDGRPNITS